MWLNLDFETVLANAKLKISPFLGLMVRFVQVINMGSYRKVQLVHMDFE